MRQLENRKPNLTPAKRSPAVSVNLHRKFSRAIGGHFLAIRINSIGARSVGLRRSEIDGYFVRIVRLAKSAVKVERQAFSSQPCLALN